MKNVLIYLVILFLLIVVFIMGDYYNLTNCPSLKLSCPKPICPQPIVSCPKPICPQPIVESKVIYEERSLFQRIVNNLIDEKEYRPNKYDCTEFSNELSRRLEDEGWKAHRRLVRVNCENEVLFDKELCRQFGGRHDIVRVREVYIEATTGQVIAPRDYGDYGI